CFHNPEVGREAASRRVPVLSRRVLVVGAGPAGLKAAEVASKLGHQVTLVDRGAEVGGRLRWVRDSAAAEIFGSVDWLRAEIERSGVEVRLGEEIDEAFLTASDAEAVVLATGAREAPE